MMYIFIYQGPNDEIGLPSGCVTRSQIIDPIWPIEIVDDGIALNGVVRYTSYHQHNSMQWVKSPRVGSLGWP